MEENNEERAMQRFYLKGCLYLQNWTRNGQRGDVPVEQCSMQQTDEKNREPFAEISRSINASFSPMALHLIDMD